MFIPIAILGAKDYASFRPSALADLRASLDVIEREFLGRVTTFFNGEEISLGDVQVAWVVRWILDAFGVSDEPGFRKEDFPNVYVWFVHVELGCPDDKMS